MKEFDEPVLLSTKILLDSDRKFRVALYGPDNYKAAVISHYIYSKNKRYRNSAVEYAKELLDGYIDGKITNQVAEECIRDLFGFDVIPFPKPPKPKFTFIDLFAGIGGFRIAMQRLGGECVFSSEWDKNAQQTYFKNFGELPFGDITKPEVKKWIPKTFDVLCAGFPCQPFSIAGVVKKNSLGRKHGFEDERQGNLFFHIVEIIEEHRPKVFFLENVKNLISHDKKNTFRVIRETLLDLGYSFDHKVLDGEHFVPQHRERTFMIGFDKSVWGADVSFDFNEIELPEAQHKLKDILEPKVDEKYTLTNHLWRYLQDYAQKHKEKGNGFGFGLTDLNGIARTLSARYYKDGSEILIPQTRKNPRRLTPRECARLQGYPDDFLIPVSDTQAYRQFGNSVTMPLVQAIGENIVNQLLTIDEPKKSTIAVY